MGMGCCARATAAHHLFRQPKLLATTIDHSFRKPSVYPSLRLQLVLTVVSVFTSVGEEGGVRRVSCCEHERADISNSSHRCTSLISSAKIVGSRHQCKVLANHW